MTEQMQQLETEIARLQLELRQVRQMIGSLIRTEQETMHMMQKQYAIGNNIVPQPYMDAEYQEMQQYNNMQRLVNQANSHLQDMAGYYQHDTTAYRGAQMNPRHGAFDNDPMVRPS